LDGALTAAETWHLKWSMSKMNINGTHASGFTSDSLVTNTILYLAGTTALQIDVRKLLRQKHFKRQNGSVKGSTVTQT